jgi:hypothetical protein
MSFELFVQCFDHGEFGSFPREIVERLFGPFVIRRDSEWIDIEYDAQNSATIYMSADAGLDGFMVHRPCGDRRLYEALLAILRSGNLVMYWPGDGPALIGQPETARHLPQDLIDTLGEPVVVGSPDEIKTAIAGS